MWTFVGYQLPALSFQLRVPRPNALSKRLAEPPLMKKCTLSRWPGCYLPADIAKPVTLITAGSWKLAAGSQKIKH
jgi:hypothetical protein